MYKRPCLMMMLAGLVLTMVGCAENKLTRQNFDTIHEGKSNKMEVKMTMGDKFNDRGELWEYEDMDRSLSVVFHFDKNDKVVAKEWRDAGTGKWDGAAPHMNETPEGKKTSDESSNMTIKKK